MRYGGKVGHSVISLINLKISMRWFFFLFLPQYSKRNRKFKHLVQTKPMGENTITNIMKVSVAGTSQLTSLFR